LSFLQTLLELDSKKRLLINKVFLQPWLQVEILIWFSISAYIKQNELHEQLFDNAWKDSFLLFFFFLNSLHDNTQLF
jgi:hypothetical protein